MPPESSWFGTFQVLLIRPGISTTTVELPFSICRWYEVAFATELHASGIGVEELIVVKLTGEVSDGVAGAGILYNVVTLTELELEVPA